jgi:hypothetical protein
VGLTQPNNYVDVLDAAPSGRLGQAVNMHGAGRNVMQPAVCLIEEMMMGGDVGVEINAIRIDQDLAQKTRFGELMNGVIDRGQRRTARRRGPGVGAWAAGRRSAKAGTNDRDSRARSYAI